MADDHYLACKMVLPYDLAMGKKQSDFPGFDVLTKLIASDHLCSPSPVRLDNYFSSFYDSATCEPSSWTVYLEKLVPVLNSFK